MSTAPRMRLLLLVLLLGATFGLWKTFGPKPDEAAPPQAGGIPAFGDAAAELMGAPSRPAGFGEAVGFRDPRRLAEHHEKHGREFGAITEAEYLKIAQELRDAPAGGPILERVRKDGTITRFDRRSKTFVAYDPDGTIRTCFKPAAGETYFRRQAER